MKQSTTVGHILLKNSVPDHLKKHVTENTLDKKGISDLFSSLVQGSNDTYNDVVTKLARLGFEVSTRLGSTVPLNDLMPIPGKAERFEALEKEISKVRAGHGTKVEKDVAITKLYGDFTKKLEGDILDYGVKNNHTLAKVIMSGSRGSIQQYRQTVASPVLVSDEKGRPILDFPLSHSFAEGLTVPEYLLHSYGTRQGAIATKLAIADSGYFSKQLSRSSYPIKIEEHDCGTDNGIPVSSSDKDSIGTYLAHPVASYKKNNEVTGAMLAALRAKDIDEIVVRSPITCQASRNSHSWAVCQLCAGKREKQGLSQLGSYIGITAATALGEPLSQGQLNCLEENTLVRMFDYSTCKIKDLKVGDIVLGADKNGHTFPSKVTHVWDQGMQPTYRYEFSVGKTKEIAIVEATEIHPILANIKKWSCTGQADNKQLQVVEIGKKANDYNAARPISYTGNEVIKEPRALLLGLLLGDGCYTAKVNQVGFSCGDPKLITDLEKYLAGLNLKLVHSKDYYYRVNANSACFRNPAKQFLKELNIFGKYAHEKEIPQECYSWDNNSIADLISGLIITDGSVFIRGVKYAGVSFASTSRRLVEQVKELLEWRFAVYGNTITKINSAGNEYRNHDQWQFIVTTPKELKKFNDYIKLYGVKHKTLQNIIELISTLKDDEPSYLMKRKNITYLGERHCYDISVEHKDSLFVSASGVIVSNTKHTAGSASLGKNVASGFKLIEQLANPRHNFPDKAAVASVDGKVQEIKKLPQGGSDIIVHNGVKKFSHYVSAGFDPHVKVGDEVEAGDVLSGGTVNPADIVQHKGIGEGRRYFTEAMGKAFSESGMGVNRRNFETIARGHIDHVRINHPDGLGEHLPDDVVSYQAVEKDYKPRQNAALVRIDQARNKYLEEPVLHYTIGTRITSKVQAQLKKHNIQSVYVHDEAPHFEPQMMRLLDVPAHVPDWAHQLYSTYLEKKLINGVNTGMTTSLRGPSPIMGLAYGKGFGTDDDSQY